MIGRLPDGGAEQTAYAVGQGESDRTTDDDAEHGYATQIAIQDGASLHAVHVVLTFATGRVAGQNAYLNEDG